MDSLTYSMYFRTRTLLLHRLGWDRNTFSVRRKKENFTHPELQILAYTLGCSLQDLEDENHALNPENFRWEDEPIVAA